MSMHIEWDDATSCEVEIYTAEEFEEEFGDTIEATHSLVLGGAGGGCLSIEGSRAELVAFAQRVLKTVSE